MMPKWSVENDDEATGDIENRVTFIPEQGMVPVASKAEAHTIEFSIAQVMFYGPGAVTIVSEED